MRAWNGLLFQVCAPTGLSAYNRILITIRYTGSLVRYEDEGIASIDLGTATDGSRRSGFCLDIELEMDKGNVEMNLQTANANTTADIPILIIEDVDNNSELLDHDIPQNLDVQEIIYEAGHHPSRQPSTSPRPGNSSYRSRSSEALTCPSKPSINIALANVTPLFRVLDVHVDLYGVRFQIDQSRHWVFNKLIIEPFAGPLIRSVARQTLEERVRKVLEAVASGVALIIMEAKERAVNRRVRQSVRAHGTSRFRRRTGECEDEEDGKMKLSDLYAAFLERGPEIFRYYTNSDIDAATETHAELTNRGIILSKQTHTHIQRHQRHSPAISPTTIIPLPGSANDGENVEDIEFPSQQEREDESSVAERPKSSSEETQMRVAVGTGAQLFPGKGGPYDAMKNTTRIGKTALQEVENSVQEAKTNIEEGYERIKGGYQQGKGKGKRFTKQRECECECEGRDWRSSVFDF